MSQRPDSLTRWTLSTALSTALAATTALTATAALAMLAARPATAAAAPEKITLRWDPAAKKLSGFPATVKGGLTTISLTNPKTATYGITLELTRTTSKKTEAEIRKAMKSESIPSWALFSGGTATARPGTTTTATLNLAKGDWISSLGSNDQTLDEAPPIGFFTVSTGGTGTIPKAAAAIAMKDYGFEITGLKAGVTTVTASNPGKGAHHVIMLKLMPGKTFADAQKYLMAEPPKDLFDRKATTSVPTLQPGMSQTVDLDLTKGTYAFICYMPDKTGAPHITKGMVKEVTIA